MKVEVKQTAKDYYDVSIRHFSKNVDLTLERSEVRQLIQVLDNAI